MKRTLALGLLLLVGACKEPVTVEPEKSYAAMSSGDYRVYTVTNKDERNQPTTTSRDSVVTGQKITYAGMDAFSTVTFTNDTAAAPVYVASLNDALYTYFAPVMLPGLPFLELSWVKDADFKSSAASWVTFDTTLVNFPFNFLIQGTANGTIRQTRTRGNVVDVTLGNGTTVKALEIVATTSVNTMLSLSGIPFPVPLTFDNVETFYYARGIGLVRSKRDSYKIGPPGFEQLYNGYDKVLLHYDVK